MNLICFNPRAAVPTLRFGLGGLDGTADAETQQSIPLIMLTRGGQAQHEQVLPPEAKLSYSSNDLSRDVQAGMEGRGYRQKNTGEKTFGQVLKNSWAGLWLALASLGGFGFYQGVTTTYDLSAHRPEAVALEKTLDSTEKQVFLRGEANSQEYFQNFIAETEAFQKLDAATREKILTDYRTKIQEVQGVRESIGQQKPVGLTVFCFVIGLVSGLFFALQVLERSSGRNNDATLELLARTFKMPKTLLKRLREKRFELKPMAVNSAESKKLAEGLVRISQQVSENHRELTRCLDTYPEVKQDFLAAYGEIPKAEALMQGVLWMALEQMLTKPGVVPDQPLSKTKVIDELSVVERMEGVLNNGTELGLIVPQLLAEEFEEFRQLNSTRNRSLDQTAQTARRDQVLIRLFKASVAHFGVAFCLTRERLEHAEAALKTCLASMQAVAKEQGTMADQRLMALQGDRMRLEGEVESLKKLVSLNRTQLADKRQSLGNLLQKQREQALGQLTSAAFPGGAELPVEDAGMTPESLRLGIQAEQLFSQLNGEQSLTRES